MDNIISIGTPVFPDRNFDRFSAYFVDEMSEALGVGFYIDRGVPHNIIHVYLQTEADGGPLWSAERIHIAYCRRKWSLSFPVNKIIICDGKWTEDGKDLVSFVHEHGLAIDEAARHMQREIYMEKDIGEFGKGDFLFIAGEIRRFAEMVTYGLDAWLEERRRDGLRVWRAWLAEHDGFDPKPIIRTES